MDASDLETAPPPVRPAIFVEASAASRRHRNQVAGVGLRWPVSAPWLRAAGALEVGMHRWSPPADGGGDQRVQLAVVPMLRWRPAPRWPAWFVEAGIGLSWHDGPYADKPGERITRWNFQDVLAVGRSVGPGAGQEVSLRWSHVSNAGLRKPNPGDDRLSVRWTIAW